MFLSICQARVHLRGHTTITKFGKREKKILLNQLYFLELLCLVVTCLFKASEMIQND